MISPLELLVSSSFNVVIIILHSGKICFSFHYNLGCSHYILRIFFFFFFFFFFKLHHEGKHEDYGSKYTLQHLRYKMITQNNFDD